MHDLDGEIFAANHVLANSLRRRRDWSVHSAYDTSGVD